MNEEDTASVKWMKKRIAKGFQFFIASKTGGNAQGRGKMRSVILGKSPQHNVWVQSVKIWGHNNEERAKEIMKQAYSA